jgi:hypothetical protein
MLAAVADCGAWRSLVSAPVLGTGGRGFKSRRPDHRKETPGFRAALRGLDLVPHLDAAQDTLERVDRAAIFHDFEDTHAIQYFYEPFLAFFGPALRKQLGVWYPPPEIVRCMVERVDRVLRSKL